MDFPKLLCWRAHCWVSQEVKWVPRSELISGDLKRTRINLVRKEITLFSRGMPGGGHQEQSHISDCDSICRSPSRRTVTSETTSWQMRLDMGSCEGRLPRCIGVGGVWGCAHLPFQLPRRDPQHQYDAKNDTFPIVRHLNPGSTGYVQLQSYSNIPPGAV